MGSSCNSGCYHRTVHLHKVTRSKHQLALGHLQNNNYPVYQKVIVKLASIFEWLKCRTKVRGIGEVKNFGEHEKHCPQAYSSVLSSNYSARRK